MARGTPNPAPEVLAPAGDRACLDAAIEAGADAVYFGLEGFNARARATNFPSSELEPTMQRLHDARVRGYVTLNTLVFDQELGAVEAQVRACAAAGVDAVIVQDLGVLRLVRDLAPELHVHGSTQMTCTDAGSVALAADLGVRRVILARELSLDAIETIARESAIDLEVFVHGALCVAYSGQCLTSEAIGGRSANRGACAQACRLPYELVVDGVKKDLGDRAYLLSPEDLVAIERVPRLVQIGVRALKIEGRLKDRDYVAATTLLYKKAVLAATGVGAAPDASDRDLALQLYSRGSGPGFLLGADHQHLVEGRSADHRGLAIGTCRGTRLLDRKPHLCIQLDGRLEPGDGILVEGGFAGEGELGGRVWSLQISGRPELSADAGSEALVWLGPDKSVGDIATGRRVFKTSDPKAKHRLRALLDRGRAGVPIDMRLQGAFGGAPVLRATGDDGLSREVTLDAVLEPARTAPLDRAAARAKLGRLGDTPFSLRDLAFDLPEGATLPISSLNRARRAIVAKLLTLGHRAHLCTEASASDLMARSRPPEYALPSPGVFVLCRTREQAEASLEAGAAGVYLDFLDLKGLQETRETLRRYPGAAIGIAPPRIRKPGEERIGRMLESLAPDMLLVRSLGALADGPSAPVKIGDFSLNVTNRVSAATVLGRGLGAFTPAFDLDAEQLTELVSGELGPFAEVVVHHPMPLFHMDHCLFAALLSSGTDARTCGRPCDRHTLCLRDRTGRDHPVFADVGCRNTVFHGSPQSGVDLVPELVHSGVRRLRVERLLREDREMSARVVRAYLAAMAGSLCPQEVLRTLGSADYHLVRGSLRVLAT